MRLIYWVTALAVLSIAWAKNSTTKTKPKRQLENIRTAQNLQYSLVLPHSRVQHYRSLGNNNNRRISHSTTKGGRLPPYAVQMEPVVQYSQKDPLYNPNHDNIEDSVVNKNEIFAQSKILNTHDSDESYGPPYGSLPTAPLYSHEPHYIEAPEPIIEIIIKESNETLPAPPPPPVQKKKKEPVHVFYVKYSKDPHSKDKVIYEKPIPAITPPTNEEEHEEHYESYVTVTPEPYISLKTTTLRAIIKPESEVYHSDSSVRVTFGSEGRHFSDRRESNTYTEEREETAPRPAIAFPNQPQQQNHPFSERSAPPQFSHETETKSTIYHPNTQNFRAGSQHAQSRIQFQAQPFPTDQQLPRQNPTTVPFRSQTPSSRHPFASPASLIPNPAFSNGPPGIITHFGGPTPTPITPAFPTNFPRPNNGPSFHSRPVHPPSFNTRPFNSPSRTSFHSGPQRPFHQPPQKTYFDEAKYLQENYHTITTEQVDPAKDQLPPNRQTQSFNRPSPPSPSPTSDQFPDHFNRPQIPLGQQLPQQRPAQHFVESSHSKPSIIGPSSSPFFNLKPSPPHIENSRPVFHQPSQQFNFNQGSQPLSSSLSAIPPKLNLQQTFVTGSPSTIQHNPFLPQPSSPTLFNYQSQPSPSPTPEQFNFHRLNSPSERPNFQSQQRPSDRPQLHQSHGPSEQPSFLQNTGQTERPPFSQQNNREQQSSQHQHVNEFVPNGGELIHSIPKYEQHITVNGPSGQTNYNLLNEPVQPSTASAHNEAQYHQQQQQKYQQQQRQQQQEQEVQRYKQQEEQRQQDQQRQQQHQQDQHRQQQQQIQLNEQNRQQQLHEQQQQQHQQRQQEAEQEQVRLQLAQNVRKQQEEIQRLQTQLLQSQQHQAQYNQQTESSSPRSQYIQERSRFQSSTTSPAYYQSTSRTVEIKPSTQKYVSSTANSISTTPEPNKEEKKNKPRLELPDEVPDDLRQQLLSSGILDNADISVLDYDKVGETPLESLPPDQLANFFSAGGAQQISASETRPIYVKPNGDKIESRIDEMEEDQEIAASENVPTYVVPPPSQKQAVEMKVVHFDPNTAEGQKIAEDYVKENATQVEPVALNDKKYNRYLPLKVSGNQFPLPDILKGRKVTSVVVLAPVETEALSGDHSRKERATPNSLKGIKFVAGDILQDVLKKPTRDNFKKWLDVEKQTASDLQSIILLVTGSEKPEEEREIFMYDIGSGTVNKLSGELSSAFVEAAENNSLTKDIETLAIEGEGTPEIFQKDSADESPVAAGSENVPLFVDLSGVSLNAEDSNYVSISSGYSKTKLGRSLRRP